MSKFWLIKLMATIFCAAAVLIPIFHIETACTAVIINNEASLLSLLTLNAAIIPSNIGTTAPARAVADGTKNARTIDTKIAPMTIFLVLFPTIDSTSNASRLCKLVSCIATAKNNAAATSATAEVEKPLKA